MRGLTALLVPSKYRFNQMYPLLKNASQAGTFGSSTPKKQEKNESCGEMGIAANKDMVDPIATFSRPPPLPPVIGPLVLLTLLDSWWNHDDSN
ncbi:uncharacterized protein LOC107643091 [Arachis ipaensis]|uniref:uncharacterized protein LOC107643091 n=1 Tax=Arachis ipaensis TaxID=130454 RepID=UPI000A2B9435|nr:uncharacterized protein LOC107643091 [Arachis ipaensis]